MTDCAKICTDLVKIMCQLTEIQAKREQLQEKLQTPDAKSEIAKNSEQQLVQDKERLVKLEALDRKMNELTNEKHDIIALKNIIPSRRFAVYPV
jgi:hypothetical protein